MLKMMTNGNGKKVFFRTLTTIYGKSTKTDFKDVVKYRNFHIDRLPPNFKTEEMERYMKKIILIRFRT